MKDWDRLREIFEEAWPLHDEERGRLLDERCGDNAKLRHELEKLLRANDEETRTGEGARRFGVWETGELVGRGGMAEVYLAHRVDGHHEQRAAVKIMARHMFSWDDMDRFRREREILGRLEHPNIARLFDGGVSEQGEPYMVMEFVDGMHLDEYCREKHLSIAERLRLFLPLCSAVESAHRNLVLHRDIKPSNVLVTHDGAVKLVDFGTARRMDGSSLVTAAPLTPSYASPEQLRGEAVTTQSDVYGLGMTLYKLVTGTLPFGTESKTTYQTVRETLEGVARPPSAAPGLTPEGRHTLRGDIDNIVLKAIDHNPSRRYVSADRLEADIRRHLEKRPVEARSRTWAYRAERFVARNRLGVALAAVLLVTIVAATVGLAIAERRARREAERSKQMATFLTHMMGLGYDVSSGPFRAEGRSAHMVDAIRYMADQLPIEMAGQPQLEARLLTDIGHAFAELGYTDEAGKDLRRALQLVDRKQDPLLAAEAKGYLARDLFLEGDLPSSAKLFDEAAHEMKAAGRPVPPAVESLFLLNAAAVPMTRDGASPEVRREIDQALALAKQVGTASPLYALAMMNHGALTAVDNAAAGEREIQQGLDIENAMKPRPLEWCIGEGILGMYRAAGGALDDGARMLNDAYPCEAATMGAQSQQVCDVRLALLKIEAARGNRQDLIPQIEAWENEVGKDFPKAGWMRAEGTSFRASLLCAEGKIEEGVRAFEDVVAVRSRELGPNAMYTLGAEKALAACAARQGK